MLHRNVTHKPLITGTFINNLLDARSNYSPAPRARIELAASTRQVDVLATTPTGQNVDREVGVEPTMTRFKVWGFDHLAIPEKMDRVNGIEPLLLVSETNEPPGRTRTEKNSGCPGH